jgi:hypothetical protein
MNKCSMKSSVLWDITTLCYIPEDRALHNRRCENLKSYKCSMTQQPDQFCILTWNGIQTANSASQATRREK